MIEAFCLIKDYQSNKNYFMKIRMTISILISLAGATCNYNHQQKQANKQTINKGANALNNSHGLTLASKKDTICGMMVDNTKYTVTVNGKLYGFCSKNCKEEFEKQLNPLN